MKKSPKRHRKRSSKYAILFLIESIPVVRRLNFLCTFFRNTYIRFRDQRCNSSSDWHVHCAAKPIYNRSPVRTRIIMISRHQQTKNEKTSTADRLLTLRHVCARSDFRSGAHGADAHLDDVRQNRRVDARDQPDGRTQRRPRYHAQRLTLASRQSSYQAVFFVR